MKGVLRDSQYAIRNLLKRPGFLAIVLITLAFGIGGTTAIFGATNVEPADLAGSIRDQTQDSNLLNQRLSRC